ncbi:hypothetical protein BGZ51_007775 [Haplosporangium sp. Z 767]|nr:hypothetical protein BGZ51_007775 [Haplosporangium sp. Z 767]
MAYATVKEETLYIQGGLIPEGSTDQLYSLDLTRNWTTSNPPWKELVPAAGSAPAPSDPYFSNFMTISQDSQTITIRARDKSSQFSLKSMTWSPQANLTGSPTVIPGLMAATDPNTGFAYVPYGSNEGLEMTIYEPDGRVSEARMPLPKFMISQLVFFSAVWSVLRGTIMIYGAKLFDAVQ